MQRLQAVVGYAVLIGTGVALLIPHAFLSHGSPLSMLIGGLFPGLLALSIISSTGLLYYEDVSSGEILRISFWTLAIGIVGAGIAGSMILYLWSRGVVFSGSLFVVTNSAVGGATVGLIVGVYSADRYATKRELNNNRHRITALNERLTVLNRVLRHDIRNDINVIQGYAQLIEEGRVDTETALEMIQQKSVEIADFSERAREIESLMHERAQECQALDLVPTLKRELEEVRSGYLGVEIEADLPERAVVLASPLIESAVDNVVENAVEHNDKPTARVDVTLESASDGCVLEVADNGPGLPAHERQLLAGEQETKLKHSDGLGLWLVNWIVEESDGTIAVETEAGSGTTIEIWLPGAPDAEVIADGLETAEGAGLSPSAPPDGPAETGDTVSAEESASTRAEPS